MSLRESLEGWVDQDCAQYELGVILGLIDPKYNFHVDTKHVFWSNNPVGNSLYAVLRSLTDAGVLQFRDEPDLQFRWNPEFRGTWEPSTP